MSEQTARSRANDLWIYAEFLARTYNRTLTMVITPRWTNACSSSTRTRSCRARQAVSRIFARRSSSSTTSQEPGVITDDAFAQALWRRRAEAARVVEIYNRIGSDWPDADLPG